MIKWMGVAFAAAVVAAMAGVAAAQSPDVLYLSIYADRQTPYVESADGRSHAFLCLSKAPAIGLKDICYGFFARPSAVTSIRFDNGGGLKRVAGADWVESPTGFHFTQQPTPADTIVLVDGKRQISWVLASPHGASQLRQGAAMQPAARVTGITFTPGGAGFIGGVIMAPPYRDAPMPPSATSVAYRRAIGPAQFQGLIKAIEAWNAQPNALTRDGYIGAITAVITGIGGKAPVRSSKMTVADYVAAIAPVNP
jgi:hypothetical protein